MGENGAKNRPVLWRFHEDSAAFLRWLDFLARIYQREVSSISLSLLVSVAINLGNMDLSGSLPSTRFVADYLLGAFFQSLARGPGVSLLSQVIGPHPQAAYMGVLFLVGALPRVLGPFVFVRLLLWPEPLFEVDYVDVYKALDDKARGYDIWGWALRRHVSAYKALNS